MMCANHPDREHEAFCQNCGKPLCRECMRPVGAAVYCEQCLEAKLHGSVPPPPTGGGNWTYSGGDPGFKYNVSGTIPPPAPPPPPGAPNPGLAAILGFIPGVGAMYNGQFAKGIVHLAIFAVLVSLSDHVNGVFGIFVAGWIFYMVFDAYQTAKARRYGTPLPNPFGLNEVGEKFGFGSAWPSANAGGPAAASPTAGASVPPTQPPPSSSWSAPYGNPSYQGVPPTQPYAGSFDPSTYDPGAYAGYSTPPGPPFDPSLQRGSPRFPVGAIWMIALGLLFLFGNSHFFFFRIHTMWPLLLIAFGVWSFISRMQSTGYSLENDGSPTYQWRVIHALRRSGWMLLFGILGLFNVITNVSWGVLWPFILIYMGLWAVLERTAWSRATVGGSYGYGYPPVQTAPPPPSASSTPVAEPGTSIVPAEHPADHEEGR